MVSDFHIASNSLFIISTSSHNTQHIQIRHGLQKQKAVESCEEADKNKGTARSSNQKCKVYKMFNIIFVGLWHEPKFSPGSAIRWYNCAGTDCSDPYTPRIEHNIDCGEIPPYVFTYCLKNERDIGKCFHNQRFNIYIRQSNRISQNITKFSNY